MAVSLPLVFLILDFWPLGRLQGQVSKVLAEKIPFFICSLGLGVVTVAAQFQAGAGPNFNQVPLSFRLMNACHALFFYGIKMACPAGLAALYPLALTQAFSIPYVLSALGVLLISGAAWAFRKKFPALGTAWLFFLLTLAPTLGILQVGNQAAADRFTYLPSLAPFLLAASFLAEKLSHRRSLFLVVVSLAVLLLGGMTFRQVSVWKNTVSLWERVLQDYPLNNPVVFQNLGRAYEDEGALIQALDEYGYAAQGAQFFYPHWGKGKVYAKMGERDKSVAEFKAALVLAPSFPPLHSDLAMVYGQTGKGKEALAEAQKAVELDPRYSDGYMRLGILYENQGRWTDAVEAFKTAHTLDPDNADYFRDLAKAFLKAGEPREALSLYKEIRPRSLLAMRL